MKKISAFIMAATLAGVFELAAAKSENHRTNDKAVITTGKSIAVADTIPTKKKKNDDYQTLHLFLLLLEVRIHLFQTLHLRQLRLHQALILRLVRARIRLIDSANDAAYLSPTTPWVQPYTVKSYHSSKVLVNKSLCGLIL